MLGKARRIHMAVDIRGILSWSPGEFRKIANSFTKDDGTAPTPDELREFLFDCLSEGKRVLPMSKNCDGFDFVKGCPGHEVQDEERAC